MAGVGSQEAINSSGCTVVVHLSWSAAGQLLQAQLVGELRVRVAWCVCRPGKGRCVYVCTVLCVQQQQQQLCLRHLLL